MNALEFVYFVLHVVLCVAVGWLLCLRGQRGFGASCSA